MATEAWDRTPAHWIHHPGNRQDRARPKRDVLDWMAVVLTVPAVLFVVLAIATFVMSMLHGPYDMSCMLEGCER